MTSEPLELRARNLKRLISEYGGPTNLAKALGYKGPSYLSQMGSGHRPVTFKTARAIEETLELGQGWMDKDHGLTKGVPKPVDVDVSTMSQVVTSVGAALEEDGIALPNLKFASLVALVYEQTVKEGELDLVFIRRLVHLLK